jgi:hypothetical protein
MSVLGEQVKIPGSFWEGRMTPEERATSYLCTVLQYSLAHRLMPGDTPGQMWQVLEMGASGTGSTEHGDSSGDKFWVPHSKFLKFYWDTFPERMPVPDGPPPDVVVLDDGAGAAAPSAAAASTSASGADVSQDKKQAPILKFWKLESDELRVMGPRRGERLAIYSCLVQVGGEACGTKRQIWHKDGKAATTSNLHKHFGDESTGCAAHKAALDEVRAMNKKMVLVNGEYVRKHNFAEAFPHHVHAVWLRAAGVVSANFFTNTETHDYVHGYEELAVFPTTKP